MFLVSFELMIVERISYRVFLPETRETRGDCVFNRREEDFLRD